MINVLIKRVVSNIHINYTYKRHYRRDGYQLSKAQGSGSAVSCTLAHERTKGTRSKRANDSKVTRGVIL